MATIDARDLMSILGAGKLDISALVREAEERLEQLQQLEDDLWDFTLVAARMATTGPDRHALDEVLRTFDYTRDQLAALPDELSAS